MALSSGTLGPFLCRVSEKKSRILSPPSSSLSFSVDLNRKRTISIRSFAASAAAAAPAGSVSPAISLSEKALNHLNKMRAEKNEDLCLRIGVKQGGCSGMSYTMEFENHANRKPDDSTIEYNGFTIVCDPKSLLFVYGMQLDFSDALIGGGFSFKNPNATKTCGCGKSFATEDNGMTSNSGKEASCTN